MTPAEVYNQYAIFIRQQLEGNYLEQSRIQMRLNRATSDIGELSRLFNDIPQQPEIADQLYSVFSYDFSHAYEQMHTLLKITLQQILNHKEHIATKLPSKHQDLFTNPEKINLVIQAITTGCMLELNAAYDRLPAEQQAREKDEFMYFRNSMDTFIQQHINIDNIFSEELIKLPESEARERLHYFSEMWEMKNENVDKMNHLKNAVLKARNDLIAYFKKNIHLLSTEQEDTLCNIIEKLNEYYKSIRFQSNPFFETYQNLQIVQDQLHSIEQVFAPKKEPKKNLIEQLTHNLSKILPSTNTISDIATNLNLALEQSSPNIPINITRQYKDKLHQEKLSNTLQSEEIPTASPTPR